MSWDLFVRAGHNPDSPGFGSGHLLGLLSVRVLNQAWYFRGHQALTNVVDRDKSGFTASPCMQFQFFSCFLALPMAGAYN